MAAQTVKDTTQLKEVVIIDNRFQTSQKTTAQNISCIDATQLQHLPVRSLAEALSYVPGVDIRQRSPFGGQADIGLRGGSFEQTLLLVNGMKLTDPQTGHHAMSLPLPFFSLQQIDVLKGPAARIYGQNAFAGAINISTTLPDRQCFKVQVFSGDFALHGANVLVALPTKKIRQVLSVSLTQNGNYNYNTDAKQGSALYEAQISFNTKHSVRALFAASTRSMGANGFYSDKYPDQWESISTLLAGITYSFVGKHSKFQLKNYLRVNNDEFRLKRTIPSFYTNLHQSTVIAVEGNGSVKSKWGQTGYGVDLRREQISSSNLGEHQRSILGAYFEHKIQIASLSARAGVYGNFYDKYGLRYFPGAEIGYEMKKNHFMYSNWGFSFRIPTYTEMYYKDPVTNSNPNLLPEKAQSIELGYRYMAGSVSVEANVFHRATRNMIDYSKNSVDSGLYPNLWTPNNYSQLNFSGTELVVNYKTVVKDSNFAITSIRGSYNYIFANFIANETQVSRYSLNQLKQQAIAAIQFLILKRISLSATTRYFQKQDLSRYLIFDAKSSYNITKQIDVFAECSNISNQVYIETGFVQMPGRWFRAGITLQF